MTGARSSTYGSPMPNVAKWFALALADVPTLLPLPRRDPNPSHRPVTDPTIAGRGVAAERAKEGKARASAAQAQALTTAAKT